MNNSTGEKVEFGSAVDRILTGIELVKNGTADFLLISGGDGALFDRGKSESEMLEAFAIRWGIPEQQILIDRNSRNTFENAVESRKIIQQHNFKKLLLVTSAFHMFRSSGCFKQQDLEVDVLPVDYYATAQISDDFRNYLPSTQALGRMNAAVHEIIGITAYSITGKSTH